MNRDEIATQLRWFDVVAGAMNLAPEVMLWVHGLVELGLAVLAAGGSLETLTRIKDAAPALAAVEGEWRDRLTEKEKGEPG